MNKQVSSGDAVGVRAFRPESGETAFFGMGFPLVDTAISYPLTNLKVRHQSGHKGGLPSLTSGVTDMRKLYTGVGPFLCAYLPNFALAMMVQPPIQKGLEGLGVSNPTGKSEVLSGAGIGMVVGAPMEYAMVLQINTHKFSFWDALKQMGRKTPGRFLTGVRDGAYMALFMKGMSGNTKRNSVAEEVAIGAALGAVAGAVTTPVDAIKTMVQTQKPGDNFHTPLQVLEQVRSAGVLRVCTRGLVPRAASCAVPFALGVALRPYSRTLFGLPPHPPTNE